MIKAVIFDVDGVLLDSFEANFRFFNALVKEFGYPGMTREEFPKIFHLSMWDSIKKLTGLTDEKKIEEIWQRGHMPVTEEPLEMAMPAGAGEVIKELSKNYKLGIATSRIVTHIFEGGLAEFKQYFPVAVGFQDTVNHKPHPEPLLCAAERLGLAPQECIYVGDQPADIAAGNAAGMKVILYNKEPQPGAAALAKTFAEIPALVAQL